MKPSEIYKKLKPWFRPWLFINKDKDINASSGMWFVSVNQGSVDAYNDDEMALCLGHELGHWLQWGFLKNGGHKEEYKADRIGAELAHRAGFDVVRGCERFKKFRQVQTETHPHPMDRRAALLRIYGKDE